MKSVFLTKSPFNVVIATTVIFMVLNAFLPLNFPLYAEAAKHPFRLRITLEKNRYQLGEAVNPTLYLQNIGDDTVLLHHPSQFDVVVYDQNFMLVFRWSENHGWFGLELPPREIRAGETINATYLTWWQEVKPYFFYAGLGQNLSYYRAKPGMYYVAGIVYAEVAQSSPLIETPALRIIVSQG